MKRLVPVPMPERAGDGRPGVRGKPGLAALPPLSLYVHVPWCVHKCPYCDFNSHERTGELPEEAYLQALQADLEQAVPDIWGRPVSTVFFGGGTPSLLSAEAIDRIIGLFRAYLNLAPDVEITLEANPGTAEAGRFQGYAQAGVNRISLGIQSFDDDKLRRLGRIHDAAQARAAIEMAQRAVDRVNLDVMFALPEQTLAECERDVREALAFGTGHLSLYHLTLEPNTVFAKFPPRVPDDELGAAMQDRVAELIQAAGFDRYEVSAYARPHQACQHNLNYWRFGDYLGIGAGAHGKISSGAEEHVLRRWKLKHPQAYLDSAGTPASFGGDDVIAAERLPFEYMLNLLRLHEGFGLRDFESRTGLPRSVLDAPLAEAVQRGWLQVIDGHVQPTELGRRFTNDVVSLFLED